MQCCCAAGRIPPGTQGNSIVASEACDYSTTGRQLDRVDSKISPVGPGAALQWTVYRISEPSLCKPFQMYRLAPPRGVLHELPGTS